MRHAHENAVAASPDDGGPSSSGPHDPPEPITDFPLSDPEVSWTDRSSLDLLIDALASDGGFEDAMAGVLRAAIVEAVGSGVDVDVARAAGDDFTARLISGLGDGLSPQAALAAAKSLFLTAQAEADALDAGMNDAWRAELAREGGEGRRVDDLTRAEVDLALDDPASGPMDQVAEVFMAVLRQSLIAGDPLDVALANARLAAEAVARNGLAAAGDDTDPLLDALATGQGLDQAGDQSEAFMDALADALADGLAFADARTVAVRAAEDLRSAEVAAQTPGGDADAMIAALSSGENLDAALDGHGDPAFLAALGEALARGAREHALDEAAADVASLAEAERRTQIDDDSGSSDLLRALATGKNLRSAVEALGGDSAVFEAGLSEALRNGRDLDDAARDALAAATRVARARADTNLGGDPLLDALASGDAGAISDDPIYREILSTALETGADPPAAGQTARDGARTVADALGGMPGEEAGGDNPQLASLLGDGSTPAPETIERPAAEAIKETGAGEDEEVVVEDEPLPENLGDIEPAAGNPPTPAADPWGGPSFSNPSVLVGGSGVDILIPEPPPGGHARRDRDDDVDDDDVGGGGGDEDAASPASALANRAPTTAGDSATTGENGLLSGTLSATDPDGDELAFALLSGPDAGTLTVDSNGDYAFDPGTAFDDLAGGETRDVHFTYRVSDGNGGFADGTVALRVIGTNDAPLLTAGNLTTFEDVARSLDGMGLMDVDGIASQQTVVLRSEVGTLAVTGAHAGVAVTGSGSGELILSGTGEAINALLGTPDAVYFTPPADADGDVGLTITATDDGGLVDVRSVTVRVAAVADAPLLSASLGEPLDGPPPTVPGSQVFAFSAKDINGAGGEPADGEPVTFWVDLTRQGHNATGVGPPEVTYGADAMNGNGGLVFTSATGALGIASDDDIDTNNAGYAARTIAAAFETGTNVDDYQVIYEEGNADDGYLIAVYGGRVITYAYSTSGGWGYKSLDLGPVAPETVYSLAMVHDSGAPGGGTLTGYVNGRQAGMVDGVGVMDRHGGGIAIGAATDAQTIDPDDPHGVVDVTGTVTQFTGAVGELRLWNEALDPAEVAGLSRHLAHQWGLPDPDIDIPFNVAAALVDTDGSEVLSVELGGIPDGVTLTDGAGVGIEIVDGAATLDPSHLSGLTFHVPDADADGLPDIDLATSGLTVTATAEDSNGDVAQSHVVFTGAPPTLAENFALSFDGLDDAVRIADHDDLDPTASFTLEAWIRPDAVGGDVQAVLSHLHDGGFEIALAGDRWMFTVNTADGPQSVLSNDPVTEGAWVHVAGIHDHASGELVLAVNGVRQSDARTLGTAPRPADGDLMFGARSDGAGGLANGFRGAIEEVRLWTSARSDSDLSNHMTRQLNGDEAGLAGYWNANEGAGAVVADGSGRGHAGAIEGGAVYVNLSNPSLAAGETYHGLILGSDPDGGPLTYGIRSDPLHADSLVLDGNTYTYVHDGGGDDDSFTVAVTDDTGQQATDPIQLDVV